MEHTFDNTLKQAVQENWLERILNKDSSLWSDDASIREKVDNRLGWINSMQWLMAEIGKIEHFRKDLLEAGIKNLVLLGMGGSSLAPEVFSHIHGQDDNALKFLMLDDTAPSAVNKILHSIDLKETVFIVASKSGSTIETDSFFRFFYSKYDSAEAGNHFIAITDPSTMMQDTAEKLAFRHAFINPSDIGGRFSVLSYFGIVPAVLMGVDVREVLQGAQAEHDEIFNENAEDSPPALSIAVAMGTMALNGKNKCYLNYHSKYKVVEQWIDQLIAESTGKLGKGILPVPTPEKFNLSKDGYWVNVNDGPNDSDIVIEENEIAWHTSGWNGIGRDFYRWQVITAIIGIILDINPFDEPDVTVAKEKTKEFLNQPEMADDLLQYQIDKIDDFEDFIADKIESLDNPYVAISIYGNDKESDIKKAKDIQQKVNQKYDIPVVVNTGPRYLHSSGQLHKGGKKEGLFLVITTKNNDSLDIPDKSYDFFELNKAQALGDIAVLAERQHYVYWYAQ